MRTKALSGLIVSLVFTLAHLTTAEAAGDEDPNPNWRRTNSGVQAKVESRADGVWIQIEVRQSGPDVQQPASLASFDSRGDRRPGATGGSETSNIARPGGAASLSIPGGGAQSPGLLGRTWYDASRGYFHETPDGHVTRLNMPSISNASAEYWRGEFGRHPGESPWMVFRDDQLIDLIWLPSGLDASTLRFGESTAEVPADVAQPGGGAGGTDPRAVALDLLTHAPLPNIRVRMNPSLGLVAVPGWFWIDGYDGRPFGLSQAVDVPPAVSADVPFSVVPASDPRRQGTSFTVDVRIWARTYEWSFGDGASLVTRSLGRAYPAESEIQHTYRHSSLPFRDGFPVRVTVEYAADYQENGGASQPLPSIRRPYESGGYRVQEAQAVLTGR